MRTLSLLLVSHFAVHESSVGNCAGAPRKPKIKKDKKDQKKKQSDYGRLCYWDCVQLR